MVEVFGPLLLLLFCSLVSYWVYSRLNTIITPFGVLAWPYTVVVMMINFGGKHFGYFPVSLQSVLFVLTCWMFFLIGGYGVGLRFVNNQTDLITNVQQKLTNRKYFQSDRYYELMREIWEAKPPKPSWGTLVTKVEPNNLLISGYPLQDLVAKKSFLEIASLLIKGEIPNPQTMEELQRIANAGARGPVEEMFIESVIR